jgi:heme/copper-type cytochrome/quinol oxidase subunit 2
MYTRWGDGFSINCLNPGDCRNMNSIIDSMITIMIVGLIAIILFMLWKYEREKAAFSLKDSARKVPVWMVVGLLSVLVLFFPKIRERIHELQRKYKM